MICIGLRPKGRPPFRDPRRDQTMINERIRFPQVRVIDNDNAQLGVLETRVALDLARERDLDLIVVAPQATPPVCRIMDYGKYKYEKSKREKENSKKSASTEMKMVRLKPVTSEHDRQVLITHCDKFLRHGHKVRVICRFIGRQNAHPEIGHEQLRKIAEALNEVASIEGPVNKVGRDMTMNLAPRPGIKPLPKPVKDDGKHHDDDDAEFEALQARMAEGDDEEHEDDDVDAEAEAVEVVAVNGNGTANDNVANGKRHKEDDFMDKLVAEADLLPRARRGGVTID